MLDRPYLSRAQRLLKQAGRREGHALASEPAQSTDAVTQAVDLRR